MNNVTDTNTSAAITAWGMHDDLYALDNDALIERVRNDAQASAEAMELADRLEVALMKIEAVLEALGEVVPDQAQGIEDAVERVRYHG
ncbi:MAG: hypothetical protein PHT19_08860 [Methylococcus sp.]|nr:hypothetical protein [Methylococcus sp.]